MQYQVGRAMPVLVAPSWKEQEEHAVTHWPCRKLCDHCVRGRGPHKEVTRESTITIIGIEYMLMMSGEGEDT